MDQALPVELARYFTPEDLTRGAQWARWSNLSGAADLTIDLSILLLATFSPWGRRLWKSCVRWTSGGQQGPLSRVLGDDWKAGALFLALVTLLRNATVFPLVLGCGYFGAHAIGLSHESPGVFLERQLIGWVLSITVNALLGGSLGALRRRWPRRWWLAVGLATAVALVGDTIVEPLRAKLDFKVHSLDQGPLRQRLETLLTAHAAHVGDIMVIDASAHGTTANAFVTGLGPTRRLVLTDTLLKFGDDAVVGAVAHEIGHRRDERLPLRLALSAAGLLGFLWLVEHAFRFAFKRGALHEAQALPFVRALSILLLLVASPVHAAFARDEEREADALELINRRDYDEYVAEQVKLVRANAMDPAPPAYLRLLQDHPSPAERIVRALWYKERMAGGER